MLCAVPPTVEEPDVPEKTEVIEGNSVFLSCPASGIPLPQITWFRQEVPIKANTSKASHSRVVEVMVLDFESSLGLAVYLYFC